MNKKPLNYALCVLCSIASVAYATTWNSFSDVPTQAITENFSHPYSVAEWDYKLGNHRALVEVAEPAAAVQVRIVWRRHDIRPEEKNVIIYDPVKKQAIANRVVLRINREFADIVFEPSSGSGTYEVYYLQKDPEVGKGLSSMHSFQITSYFEPQETADAAWLDAHQLTNVSAAAESLANLPQASVTELQALALTGPDSQREFNSFFPMEVIATQAETADYIGQHGAGQAFLLFPETREHSIKMRDDLPLRWIERGAVQSLTDVADKNEYFVFQIGVYALKDLKGLSVEFSGLTGSTLIEPSAFRCFNTNGTDWNGEAFSKQIDVKTGKIQPLWFGIQIPEGASAGTCSGVVTVAAEGQPAQSIELNLTISDVVLADRGDSDILKMSRLRWLDSTIGIDDDVVAPYTPIQQDGTRFQILGREIKLGVAGLPASASSHIDLFEVKAQGREILARPIQLSVDVGGKKTAIELAELTFTKQAPGIVTFESSMNSDAFDVTCSGVLEADGYLRYRYTIVPHAALELDDVLLELPVRLDVAKYTTGVISKQAGKRPQSIARLRMKENTMYNSFWVGDYNAGIALQLKNHEDQWNADNRSKKKLPLLIEWYNAGRGYYALEEVGDAAVFSVHTGRRTLKAGEPFELNFALYITPFKPLEKRRWDYKIYHHVIGRNPSIEKGKQAGVYNIHHGNILNPYINYPFISTKPMKDFVEEAHALDKTVKIYYTVRELSVRASELWALRSFGDEILIDDAGWAGLSQQPIEAQKHHLNRTGQAWHAEHLVGGYRNRWHSQIRQGEHSEKKDLLGVETDSSIAVAGLTRFHNYYLEGLSWLRKNLGVDGIYLDGIGYDRAVMKRVRKAMEIEGLPASMIDFHGSVDFSWIQHAPYVDSIWYGEGAKYSADPSYWLVAISGIPFGVTGEILGNRPDRSQFRGMIYGMCRRYGWFGNSDDALALWQLWDDFEIAESDMHGFWEENPVVKTSHPDVKATIYSKKGEALLAIGSWAEEDVFVELEIDWQALGLDPSKVTMVAPALNRMQEARVFKDESIPVKAQQGWLLWIKETP